MKKKLDEKILCVLLDNDKKYFGFDSDEPFSDFEYNMAYSSFSEIGKKLGVKVVLAKYCDYSKFFVKKYWFFEKKWCKSNLKIRPDFFYDKFPITKKGLLIKKELSEKKILLNSIELDLFCKDKFLQSEIFSAFSPKTFLIENKKKFLIYLIS
jgi:hypothetical protein